MKTGDAVTIEYEGEVVSGRVILASPNDRSLMLSFRGVLGGHVTMMPVFQNDEGNYVSVITSRPVTLTNAD